MGPSSSWPCSQQPITGPYLEPDLSSPHLARYFLKSHFNTVKPINLIPKAGKLIFVTLHRGWYNCPPPFRDQPRSKEGLLYCSCVWAFGVELTFRLKFCMHFSFLPSVLHDVLISHQYGLCISSARSCIHPPPSARSPEHPVLEHPQSVKVTVLSGKTPYSVVVWLSGRSAGR
jgi:hypothetical protein